MQISEDLVMHITRELLKRLKSDSLAVADGLARPLLHLVGRMDDLSTPALVRLQKHFEIKEHLNRDTPLPQEASVLITKLNIQALVQVAEGDEGCTMEGRVLLTALLNGQPVVATKDGLIWRNYAKTAPRTLLNRYSQCEQILSGYGLKIVGEMEIIEALRPGFMTSAIPGYLPQQVADLATANQSLSQGRSGGGCRVLSEAGLKIACPLSGGPGQTLRLEPGDIMTPLAQDYARTMQINIISGRERYDNM